MSVRLHAASLCLAGMLLASSAQALDADQVSCEYRQSMARQSWESPGGDWVDRNGVRHGPAAYSTETIPRLKSPQIVQWDVTGIVDAWSHRDSDSGALMLRVDDRVSGIVNFASLEATRSVDRPTLRVEWSDGRVDRLSPSSDTYISCSARRTRGDLPILKVGNDSSAILVFPFKPRASVKVVAARLIMVSDKQYSGQTGVGSFDVPLVENRNTVVVSGVATTAATEQALESRRDVWMVERFEDADWIERWEHGGNESFELVSDPDEAGFVPLDGRALKVTLRRGRNMGLNAHYRFARQGRQQEPDEIYFRYYLRLGNNWDPTVDGGKLPGISGTYNRAGWGMRRSDGLNGWSARGAFFQWRGPEAGPNRSIGSYVYHAGMDQPSGDALGWPLGPTGSLEKNRWYSVEQHVKLNTPGLADGVVEAWIDGQLVFRRDDYRFRDIDQLHIESVWMNVYHGGLAKPAKDMSLYIDNVVISDRYIGPMRGQ